MRVLDEGIPGWIEQSYPTEGWQSESIPVPHYTNTSHSP